METRVSLKYFVSYCSSLNYYTTNKRLKKCVYYILFTTQRRKGMMSIKQAFLKSNESSLNKKSDVVEIEVASNYINDTHKVHEVSITPKVQEEEALLGHADLDALKKGVSSVTKKRGRGPYRKYIDQHRAQIAKYCRMHGTAATVSKFVSTFPNLNESTTRTMRQKYENELKQAKKEQREPKQLIANKKLRKPVLLGDIDGMVQDYLKVSDSLSS